MQHTDDRHHRAILKEIAHRAMLHRGLVPDFPQDVLAELEHIHGPAGVARDPVRDLRDLPWASIDNDDSLDLDQLTTAEVLPGGSTRLLVAIADVDALVAKSTAIDDHARKNTTSVYTAALTFPMLPEKLSTDLTSLNHAADRLALVVAMVFDTLGTLETSEVFRANVRNQAKLAYNSLAEWFEGRGPIPHEITSVTGLREDLLLQSTLARNIRGQRYMHGALNLETIEPRLVFKGNELTGLLNDEGNGAKSIIEEFMIAANGVSARYLASKGFPSLRRVVRVPKRWDRIVALAAERGSTLPVLPDSKALEVYLDSERKADPTGFPDLSLTIVKLLGSGEYVVQVPGDTGEGHFGLAVRDYAHSTAPNRRYPDLVTQRLLKAAIAGDLSPYAKDELVDIARHCTEMEDAARKVERQVMKSAAAMLLESRIGEQFDAIVTGASAKGTWVRLFDPAIEGRLETGFEGAEVGHRLRVKLASTNVERGYIDFSRVQ